MNVEKLSTNEDTVRFRKVISTKQQAQVKQNALKTPCLAKYHAEAYNDFRLFSSLAFFFLIIVENLAECHVFSRSLTMHTDARTHTHTVRRKWSANCNGKCMRFCVYQTI